MMTVHTHGMWTLVVLGTMITASVALADTAQETYDRRFATEELKVRATPTVKDDIGLARRIVDFAGQHTDNDELLVLMTRRAVQLCRLEVEAYLIAAEAHLLVARHVPEKVDAGVDAATALLNKVKRLGTEQEKLAADRLMVDSQAILARNFIDAREYDGAKLIYAAAIKRAESLGLDDMAASMQREVKLIDSRKKVLKLAERMRADASKRLPMARELMWTYLLELDDPEHAARYAMPAGDFTVGPYFDLAQRPMASLSDAETMKLGKWYSGLLSQPHCKGDPLREETARRRAILCFERYLAAHAAADDDRRKVTGMLAELSPTPATPAPHSAPEPGPTKPDPQPNNPFIDALPGQ